MIVTDLHDIIIVIELSTCSQAGPRCQSFKWCPVLASLIICIYCILFAPITQNGDQKVPSSEEYFPDLSEPDDDDVRIYILYVHIILCLHDNVSKLLFSG